MVLTDGTTAHLRPIRPDDAEAIRSFHSRQSSESIYFRYFSPRPHLSDEDLRHLTTVDGVDRMAFVAERDGAVIGVARYDRYGDRPLAEVAFFTDDEHHGRGIATLMLEYLAAYAREVGIRGFDAHVLPTNRRMVRVFTQAGFQASSTFNDGVIEVTLDIEPSEEAARMMDERARAAERQAVVRLLEPRTVAVIGAGRNPSGIGHRVLRNVLDGLHGTTFQGAVYPVHPEAHAVAGVRAYPSILEIPDAVDLAIVCVPAAEVVEVIEECGRARVRAAVVISAGFAEVGPEGARRAGAPHGHRPPLRRARPRTQLPGRDQHRHRTCRSTPPSPRSNRWSGRVGLLSQSGTLGAVILDAARRKGLGISSFVAVGNKADLSGNDLLQYWMDDDRTDVVLLYLESFGNPRRFGRNVRQVAATKPVFAVRSGAVLGQTEGGGDRTQRASTTRPSTPCCARRAWSASPPSTRSARRRTGRRAISRSRPERASSCSATAAGAPPWRPTRASTPASRSPSCPPPRSSAIDDLRLRGRRAANPVDLRLRRLRRRLRPGARRRARRPGGRRRPRRPRPVRP